MNCIGRAYDLETGLPLMQAPMGHLLNYGIAHARVVNDTLVYVSPRELADALRLGWQVILVRIELPAEMCTEAL